MTHFYDELLFLCGFEEEELYAEKSRIERAFRKLQLGPDDMERAEQWVRTYHNVDLPGVRKILRVWMLELFDLVLAKEEGKKIVYYGFPSIEGPGMAGIPGVAGRTFTAVAQTDTNVLMISQASSEQSICFVVPSPDVPKVVKSLEDELSREIERRDF